jgi:D-alanine-D-alanine ligase
MGGTSAERDVSLASGIRVAEALRSLGHAVRSVDPATGEIGAGEESRLLRGGVKRAPPTLEELRRMRDTGVAARLVDLPALHESDCVFIALHGGAGEDGTLQALFDLMGMCYTGSGHIASAVAMDKDHAKILFRAAGVPTADWRMWMAGTPRPRADDLVRAIGLPFVVKPSKEGSTVGLTIVKEASQLDAALDEAARYDAEVMLERFIAGRELTVGVLGADALPPGEIFPVHEIYDYECKYTSGMAREEFPAALTEDETRTIQRFAMQVVRALKLRGCPRIDFRLGADGVFYCLEANTLPGLTELSLVPQAAAAHGISFPELCERIVHLAIDEQGGS